MIIKNPSKPKQTRTEIRLRRQSVGSQPDNGRRDHQLPGLLAPHIGVPARCHRPRLNLPGTFRAPDSSITTDNFGHRILRTARKSALPAAALLALAIPLSADAHTLTYKQARAAAQQTADRFASQRTELKSLIRTVPFKHAYSTRAAWTQVNPDGCVGCGFDPATGLTYDTPSRESCSVTVIVRYRGARSHRPDAFVDESSCN